MASRIAIDFENEPASTKHKMSKVINSICRTTEAISSMMSRSPYHITQGYMARTDVGDIKGRLRAAAGESIGMELTLVQVEAIYSTPSTGSRQSSS